MRKLGLNSSRLQLACAAIATLAVSQAANAALSISASTTGGALSGSGITYLTFEGGAGDQGGGADLTLNPDAQLATGNIGIAAPPFFNDSANDAFFGNTVVPIGGTPDPSQYVSAGSTGSAELTFTATQTYLGILWGSMDVRNELEFFLGSDSLGIVKPGTNVPDQNGNQLLGGTMYVNIFSDSPFDRVVARSRNPSTFAFEFDNVAFGVVPEPSTYVAGGLALLPLLFGLRSRFMKK